MSARVRSDRLNPVFLKELRQALRGRTFAILFPATVAIAVALAITVLVDYHPRGNLGPQVFMPVVTVLGVAVLGLVPFSTFQSMAGEWDEGTQDLLVLSHLSPLRIVTGKLLTAAVEAGLYVCAFLPLLLFTFLLSGVDVRDVLFLVGVLYAASLAMSCVAMSLAGLSRVRYWRVILLAALAGIGLLALIGGYEVAEEFVLRGRGLGSAYASDEVLALVSLVAAVGSLSFAFAATRIAHPEDDRSGPVRLTLTALLATLLLLLYLDPMGAGARLAVTQASMVLGVLTALFAVFFVTEPERLPRRMVLRVPSNPTLAVLATPFLPGGGRGVLWWFLQIAILASWATLCDDPGHAGYSVGYHWPVDGWWRWTSMMAYFVVYLAGFSLALTRLRQRPYGPLAARLVLPSAAILSMVAPMMLGFLGDDRQWRNGEHPFMPFWVATDSTADVLRWNAVVIAGLVLFLNGPRLTRSVREVLEASRARRRIAAERSMVAADAV